MRAHFRFFGLATSASLIFGAACTLDRQGGLDVVDDQSAAGTGGATAGPTTLASSTASLTAAGGSGATGGMAAGGSGGQGGMAIVCGDGTLAEPTEQCDDNNLTDGDGCSGMCTLDASNQCPATTSIPVHATPVVIDGDTSAASNDTDVPSCNGSGTGDGNDVVFSVIPTRDGTLNVEVTGAYTMAIYVRPTCTGSELACTIDVGDITLRTDVLMGITYDVFVDGDSSSDAGPFTIALSLEACGDGYVQTGEECDDGNVADNDSCSATCTVECAAGVKHPSTFHCYRYITSALAWADARTACLAYGNGYDLAAVTSEEERDFMDLTVDPNNVWIGGHDTATEGTFVWTNGEPWSYAPWGLFEPNNGVLNEQDCVMFDALGFSESNDEFRDKPCGDAKDYVCEMTPAGT